MILLIRLIVSSKYFISHCIDFRIWDVSTGEMVNTLIHHCEAVLHLRFQNGVMVTCSKVQDFNFIVISFNSIFFISLEPFMKFLLSRNIIFSVIANCYIYSLYVVKTVEAVWNTILIMLQDRSIAVWDLQSPSDITLRRVLVGHRAAVNVVDFDDKYIVSASGDRTIKVSFERFQFSFSDEYKLNQKSIFQCNSFWNEAVSELA